MRQSSRDHPRSLLWQYLQRGLSLEQLQRITRWQRANSSKNPIESHAWDLVMTLWVIGLTGWLPAYVFDLPLAYLLCILGIFSPRMYIAWRFHARDIGRLGCEWLDLPGASGVD